MTPMPNPAVNRTLRDKTAQHPVTSTFGSSTWEE